LADAFYLCSSQYNRRFVNVVVGLGKKKGPNSNTV